MEQPVQPVASSSSTSAQLSLTGSVSPGVSRKRISKVHKKNERGETPLHVAARRGEHRLCRKLIQEGALVNARDYAGWTPLHEACYHGHFKAAKLLLGYDADVNALSDCDDTPLHDALVWLLLHSGAIRDRVDNDGKKPIDICHSEYNGIKNLLSSATIPDLYPVDDSHSSTSSSPSHPQDPQLLTVNVTRLTPEKQCLTSNNDDSVTSAETFLKEENMGSSGEPRLQSQGSYRPMNEKVNPEGDAKAPDFDNVLRNEEVKNGIRHDLDGIMPSFSMHHSVWPEEIDTLKSVESHNCSSPHGLDHDLASSHVLLDNACFGTNELKEGENCHIGRSRGVAHTEHFSSQYTSQKSNYNEKRKQRGRRRGRTMYTVTGSSIITTHTSQPDDVYEFRSSPESDVGVNKTGSAGDMERELSESPNLKRQRSSQVETISAVSFTSTAVSSQTSGVIQEGISILERDEALDAMSNVSDPTDEKADATVGRKVPPLRISLPRTPTEDGVAVVNAADDVTAVTTNNVRRNTRSTKSFTRRHQSPEQSISSVCDESIQRVTRSKLRQSGRQLRDHPTISYEASVKRKSTSWRRSSTTAASPMPIVSLTTSDELTTSGNDNGDRADAEESSHLEAATLKEDENTLLALSLMKKNSYEGFREFRSVIEERWAKDAVEEIMVPENPPNFNNYMIVQGNYTSTSSLSVPLLEEKTDVLFTEKLTAKLCVLHSEQQEKRRSMQFYQQVERERLRMQAESEVLRMLARKANECRECFSAMRVIRETNLFNTGFLEVKPNKLPIMNVSEVKLKYEKLAEIMRKRQQMEADALYAEQVFVWNAAIRKSEDPTLLSLKNAVPRISVCPLILNF